MPKIVVSLWTREHSGYVLADHAIRLAQLKVAVGKCAAAMQEQNYDRDGLVRAIFIAPEYFFAAPKAGSTIKKEIVARSLTEAQHGRILQQLKTLSQAHPRILIVPGSVAWKTPLGASDSSARKVAMKNIKHYAFRAQNLGVPDHVFQAEYHWVVNPTTLIEGIQPIAVKGRARRITDQEMAQLKIDDPDLVTRLKERLAGVGNAHLGAFTRLQTGTMEYMMRNTAYVLLNGSILFEYHKQGNFHEEHGDPTTVFVPGGKSGIVELEGVQFAFEICLDHGIGTASEQLRAGRKIDVHVVTSDYVENVRGHVVVRDGGFFVHASTNKKVVGVFKRTGQSIAAIVPFKVEQASGSPLEHHEMDLDVNDPFDLSGTFMTD